MATTINPSDQTITQYNILTGDVNNLINNVAPSSTSGNPLVSQGAASQPIFSATPTVTSITISNQPSAGTDGANKTYVDNAIAAVNPATSVVAATTASLNANYFNGASGIGATLTNAGTLAAFSIDGQSPTITQRVLIKDQSSTFQNGVYTVTNVGSGAIAWILTRALDYDQPSDINSTGVINVLNGTVNALTGWLINSSVTTVGTDAITYTKYNNAPSSVTQYNVITGGANNLLNSVPPSSTSGVPVISQGSSSQPIFGTAVVAGGGTGQTTLTNHGVLVGAGTSAITQLAAGSSGQVLRSGGASADPAYSTATYPATAGTSGNVLTSDGTNWLSKTFSINVQTFTSTGTYTPTSGMQYCEIRLVGGGGGGGGVANSAASQWTIGSGGGAGGYSYGVFSAATIGGSKSVTIGAAGTAGANTGADGGGGGTTSVGSTLIQATGGNGGTHTATGTNPAIAGGTGGVGSLGSVNTQGNPGEMSFGTNAGGAANGITGAGGGSFYGGGGVGGAGGGGVAGSAGTSYGAGGSGSSAYNQSGAKSGGAGVAGFVEITEYIIS